MIDLKINLKKTLGALGTALLSLSLVLPLAANHSVSAATDESTADTQNVILTKYGFENDVNPEDRDTNVQWDGDGAKALEGVEFDVYDVTKEYWNDPASYKGEYQDSERIDSKLTTNENGQIEKELATTSLDAQGVSRSAVYLFHETNARAGYATSADTWLTLPAAAAADGNVYIYPKNVQKTTFSHYFVKKDSVTDKELPGAEFVIKNADGKYLALTDKDGEALAADQIKAGDIDVLSNNYRIDWKDSQADATILISDEAGKFGLNGFDSVADLTAVEVSAPAGYEKAADTDFTTGTDQERTTIEDQPSSILPHTGGAGIVAFVVIGAALITLGAVAYNKRLAA